MILAPTTFDRVRTPRLRLLANQVPIPGVTSVEVGGGAHFGPDTFRATIAIGADASATAALADAEALRIETQVSLDGGITFTSLITGDVDRLMWDRTTGLLELSGRDLSAALLETRTQETFTNLTSSEIATTLAGRHGLTADVAPTITPVGRYWQIEHDRLVLGQFAHPTTEWDLLVTLARHERFDVWVSGTTLHFHSPVAETVSSVVLRPVPTPTGSATVSGLRCERSLTLAGDITVYVKSWNSKQRYAYVQSATRHGGKARAVNFVYTVPNLSAQQALAYAQARLDEISVNERSIEVEMPGELSIAPRGWVQVEGTGTRFDQAYRVMRVDRLLSDKGFHQTVRATNISATGQAPSSVNEVQSIWTGSSTL